MAAASSGSLASMLSNPPGAGAPAAPPTIGQPMSLSLMISPGSTMRQCELS